MRNEHGRRCAQWGVTTVLDMATPRPRKTLQLRHQRGIADLFSVGYPAVAVASTKTPSSRMRADSRDGTLAACRG